MMKMRMRMRVKKKKMLMIGKDIADDATGDISNEIGDIFGISYT